MLKKLKQVWTKTGEFGDRDVDQAFGYEFHDDLWEFDTTTLKVKYTPRPLANYYSQDIGSGATDPGPQDYSRPVEEEFHVSFIGATRIGYYHDGNGGFTTKLETITIARQVIGCNCFGGKTGLIDLTVSGPDGAYTYLWNDGVTTLDRGALSAGDYSVTVTHESGAFLTEEFTIEQNSRLEVEIRQQGNSVELLVTGGVEPYTFEWSDGGVTMTRNDLPGGTTTCRVLDSLGCSTEVNVTIATSRFYFSHDPIVLKLDAGQAYRDDPSTKPDLSFVCEVFVERYYLSGNFELAGQAQEQPADRNGRTVFEVQELLEPFVQPMLPVLDQYRNVVVRAQSNFCRFYLRYRERTADGLADTAESVISYLVYGGLSFEEASRGTFFNGYFQSRKPFLTWEPTTKTVLPHQPEYLYYLVYSPDITTIYRQVRVYFQDNTTETFRDGGYEGVLAYEVYLFPYSYEALDLARFETAERRIVKWEVWVADQDEVTVSETRTYVLSRRYQHTPRFFWYVNSLGGVNTLPAFGRAELQLATKTTSSAKPRVAGYDAASGDVEVDRKTGLPTLKVYVAARSKAQMQADQDFMLSPRVVLYDQDRLQAGTVKDKTYTPLDEDETRRVLQFDFELPRQRHYTPRLS